MSINSKGIKYGTDAIKLNQRYKHATAIADGYYVVCSYKQCRHIISIGYAQKGLLVECPNCRKSIRITKIGG